MMLLPTPPTRATLRIFWVLLTLAVTAFALALLWVLSPIPETVWLTAGVAVIALASVGLARPHAVALPYRAWNGAARELAKALTTYVTAVSFLVVAAASKVAGSSRFVASSQASSMWQPRETQPARTYVSQHRVPPDSDQVRTTGTGWRAPVRTWVRSPGNSWAWTLLVFIGLLRALETEPNKRRSARSSEIYTLY